MYTSLINPTARHKNSSSNAETVRSIMVAAFVLASVTTWNRVIDETFEEYFPKQRFGRIGAYIMFAVMLTGIAIGISKLD